MAHYLVIIITPLGAGFDEYTGTLIIPVYVDDLAPNGVGPVRGHSYIRYINTSRLKPKNRRSPDDILKRIFLNESCIIVMKISLRFFVPRDPMNNIPAMVQIMAWHRKAASYYLKQWWLSLMTHICDTRPQWVNIYFFPVANNESYNHTFLLTKPRLSKWTMGRKNSQELIAVSWHYYDKTWLEICIRSYGGVHQVISNNRRHLFIKWKGCKRYGFDYVEYTYITYNIEVSLSKNQIAFVLWYRRLGKYDKHNQNLIWSQ